MSNQTTGLAAALVFGTATFVSVIRDMFKAKALRDFLGLLKQAQEQPDAQYVTPEQMNIFHVGRNAHNSVLSKLKSCFSIEAILNPTAYYAGLEFASLPKNDEIRKNFTNPIKRHADFLNLVVAGPDMISFVPQDLWPQIIKNLSNVTDFFRLKQVSKSFSTLSHALIPGIDNLPVDWQKGKGNLETKIASFEKECQRISVSYNQDVIDEMGGIGFLAAIPLLEGTTPKAEIFGKTECFQDVYEWVEKNWNVTKQEVFPYGSIFVKNIETNKIKKIDFTVSILERFPPSVNWFFDTFKSDKLPDGEKRTDYMTRLANNRPCGEVVQGKEILPKEAKNGKSLMQLCDEKGNTLNFCTNHKKSL